MNALQFKVGHTVYSIHTHTHTCTHTHIQIKLGKRERVRDGENSRERG